MCVCVTRLYISSRGQMLRGSMPEKPFLNCNNTRKIYFFSFSDSAKMKIIDIWFATCLAFLYVTTNLKVLRHSCVCAIGITSSDIEISIIAIARKGSINRRLIQQDQRKCNLSIGLQMLFLELPSLRHVSFIYIGIGNQNCYYQSFYWDPFSLPPSPPPPLFPEAEQLVLCLMISYSSSSQRGWGRRRVASRRCGPRCAGEIGSTSRDVLALVV